MSSQIVAAVPGADVLGGETFEPFTLNSANNGVDNPTVLIPDVANQGVTDPNQLVTDYFTLGSPCDSEAGMEYFAEQIELIVGGSFPSFLNMGNLLVGDEIDFVLDNPDSYERYETIHASVQLELFAEFDDSSILLIPECHDEGDVRDIVTGALGTLVQASEIDGIIASMAVAEDGCNEASIVDVTDLHAEILVRFQTQLSTDARVVAAERDLILAQAALDEFLSIHPSPNCTLVGVIEGRQEVCDELDSLMNAVDSASRNLAETLADVYQEQLDNGMMPPHDSDAEAAALRERVLLGIVGLFIPLTATDVAIEAATLGFGRVARLFDGAVDYFRSIRNGIRADTDNYVAEGSEAFRRAEDIKREAFSEYPDLQQHLDYEDLTRLDDRLDAEELANLNAELNRNPSLASAVGNELFTNEFTRYRQNGGEDPFHYWWTNEAPNLFSFDQLRINAQVNGWKGPDGNTLWPPHDGNLDGIAMPRDLLPGENIDRYGAETGAYVSPAGTSFEARALPRAIGLN